MGFIAMKPFAGGNIRDARLAMTYLMRFEDVVPDPGIQTVREVEEIVGLAAVEDRELTDEQRAEIQRVRALLGRRFCHQCGYCMPCPNGVDIPMVMVVQLMWREWPERMFKDPGWWYSKAVMTGANCRKCGACEKKCPYNLAIREMLPENLEFFGRVGGN